MKSNFEKEIALEKRLLELKEQIVRLYVHSEDLNSANTEDEKLFYKLLEETEENVKRMRYVLFA